MPKEILDYLATENVGVLAVEMLDGSPHGATVHFAHEAEPFVFYFETDRSYRKSEALFGREKSRASFVVGTSEAAGKTLQTDGFVRLVTAEERPRFDAVYFAKFPKKLEKSKNPSCVFFLFSPTWWRFTDWSSPAGKKITTSA